MLQTTYSRDGFAWAVICRAAGGSINRIGCTCCSLDVTLYQPPWSSDDNETENVDRSVEMDEYSINGRPKIAGNELVTLEGVSLVLSVRRVFNSRVTLLPVGS